MRGMHACPECDRYCNCQDGEADIENCGHILTPDCTTRNAGDGENEGSFGERPLR